MKKRYKKTISIKKVMQEHRLLMTSLQLKQTCINTSKAIYDTIKLLNNIPCEDKFNDKCKAV